MYEKRRTEGALLSMPFEVTMTARFEPAPGGTAGQVTFCRPPATPAAVILQAPRLFSAPVTGPYVADTGTCTVPAAMRAAV